MNVTLWDTSSDVRKELSIQDDRTESDNRIEVMLLIGIAENNLPHIARWESTKPPYAEPHVRWCGRSVNVKIGGKCLLWLAFTSYPICMLLIYCWKRQLKFLEKLVSLVAQQLLCACISADMRLHDRWCACGGLLLCANFFIFFLLHGLGILYLDVFLG